MAGVEEEGDVAALREALRQQARAVEELRSELEEERQAAASGADEALAMILRLQAEKAAERMEAEQFRRVAEERIQHDEDTLAFLKAVVFSQEMEINSLNRRLLAVHALSPAAAVDLPCLRKLAKKGAVSRRNTSLPAAHLLELCSELDVIVDSKKTVGDQRPARTVSDIGEVIGREKEWVTRSVLAAPVGLPPPLSRAELLRAMRRALSRPRLAGDHRRRRRQIVQEQRRAGSRHRADQGHRAVSPNRVHKAKRIHLVRRRRTFPDTSRDPRKA